MSQEHDHESEDERLSITRASIDRQNPENNAVVSLGPQEGGPSCSGVLVSPTLVLTAGHCFQGLIEDGGSGTWDSRSPDWRRYQLPDPSPNPDWDSGVFGRDRIFPGHIIAGFDYRNTIVESREACQALSNTEVRSIGWTFNRRERRCFLKEAFFTVYFGNERDSPLTTRKSTVYSVAGHADIGMLRLNEPVPSDIAVPAKVMSHLFDNEDQITEFLRRHRFEAVGFTPLQTMRQRASMSYAEYPMVMRYGRDLAMFRVENGSGATIEGGDSGSPLFLQRRHADGRTRRYVVGICQGPEAYGGRYTLTGVNLARVGELIKFPYDARLIDRHVAAPIGEWLNNVMYDDFVFRHPVVPLYNWYSGSAGDNFLTSDPRWASDPLGVVPDESGQYLDPPRKQNGDFHMFRLEGFAFNPKRPQPPGTVPLWLWYNPERSDHFTTTDPRWSSDLPVRWAGQHIADGRTQDGYTLLRLEGFVYNPRLPRPPFTVPLFSWWCSTRGDNFCTTNPEWSIDPSTVRWSGESITNGTVRHSPEYRIFRLEGYVPASPIL